VTIQNATIAVTQSGTWNVVVTGTVAISGTVTVSGTVSVSGTVTISGAVTVTGSVSISGSVTVTGSVSITGSVTVTGSVTITSGTVNIQTAAGVEVNIGKQTYTPITRIIQNDGGNAVEIDPLAYNIGKYFPSGMRGWLQYFSIYIKNSSGGNKVITMNFAPRPGAPAIYTTNLTISSAGGAAGWQTRGYPTISYFWDYDSMFVWMTYTNNVTLYADVPDESSTFGDYYSQPGAGGSWAYYVYRTWYRVTMSTQSHYPVPVEGSVTIKNIDLAGTPQTPRDWSLDFARIEEQKVKCQSQKEFLAWAQTQLAAAASGFPMHFINPSGSGKTFYIHQIIGGGQYGAFSMILKSNPIVNVAGSAIGITNLYIGSATASVATPKADSTFTSEGGTMFALNTWGVSPKTYDGLYVVLPPGNSLLCKITNNHTATQYCAATIIWAEN
jgi:cytoskeletal protein CcmA (bactofilin family)